MKLHSKNLLAIVLLVMGIAGFKTSQAASLNPFGDKPQGAYDSDSDFEDEADSKAPTYTTLPDATVVFLSLLEKEYTKKSAANAMAIVNAKKADSKAATQPHIHTDMVDTLVRAEDARHLNLSADNEFKHGEIVAVIRSNGDLKYANIYAPELIDSKEAEQHADYKKPIEGYLNVTCFIHNKIENIKPYPIGYIFKIDPNTKAPAMCSICKNPFEQHNNRIYSCGHMFHLACVGNYKAEAHTLLTPGCPYCGSPCTRPECSAH